ncbi:MAG: HIT domain-containing protein, partial [archaeon]|nr:HIT domain-containing protein [archaeon]
MLLATSKTYAMFSHWPVSPYHLIILPRRHVEQEFLLNLSEVCDIFRLRVILVETIKKIANFRAYNFGVNVGEEAGQTIPHLHYHVIFRRAGDTPDPTGGIRNVIPGRGNYKKQYVDKMEIDVLAWTKRVKD